ncbi:MAG: 6-carboxytetrahydropterin synthase QueD [Clostridia bacterium]|nr:6-carboxytetrahydropterin synthase QueD [Clostridia bacterium]
MYQLTIKAHFDAAHHLRDYQGKCAQIHGHSWQVEVMVAGRELDKIGMLIDFGILKKHVNDIIGGLDHRYLNELPAFNQDGVNPTAENIARYIYEKLSHQLLNHQPAIVIEGVRVWESPNASATYGGCEG